MKTRIVNFSKWRSILILFISLLYLFTVCFWMILGWALTFFVTPIALFLIWTAWRAWGELTGERPALIIDKDGIVDRTHWYSLGRVGWEEVESIESKDFFIVQQIHIIFKNPNAVIQKEKKFFKKMVQSIQFLLKKTPMLLNSRILAIPHYELAILLKNIDFENPDFEDMSLHLIE